MKQDTLQIYLIRITANALTRFVIEGDPILQQDYGELCDAMITFK
jgi:hypothetical protein